MVLTSPSSSICALLLCGFSGDVPRHLLAGTNVDTGHMNISCNSGTMPGGPAKNVMFGVTFGQEMQNGVLTNFEKAHDNGGARKVLMISEDG